MKLLLLIMMLNIRFLSAENLNYLKYESSPYLLQHAKNPIHWMPYSQEAFTKAKKEHKDIFISIGYSTCHWCHEMLKESFENKEIAKILNEKFVSIKVDREELPHIDSYYQEQFLEQIGRYGGWPLNIFLNEDKEILYMDGYISDFKEVLLTLKSKQNNKFLKNTLKNKNSEITLNSLAKSLIDDYDDIYGGFGSGKKFPHVSKLWLMLDVAQKLNDDDLLAYFYETLDMMALRGLYDQVDGGFFRYSVDEFYRIPHFEKMLYNQAELIALYTKAYILSSNELYKNIVIETIDMLENRFAEKQFFYSASDADNNHKEGDYFTVTYDEILSALNNNSNKSKILKSINITKNGNFNGKIHLNIYDAKRAKEFDLFVNNLKVIRKTKEYPFIDKKIITSWNAMMIEAYFSASLINDKYIIKANKHLEALSSLMFERGALYHQTMPEHRPKQKGLLEDYAFFISALLAGYEADADKSKVDFAVYLLSKAKFEFYEDGIWYLNNDKFRVKADLNDKYYTSPLAKMMHNILKLQRITKSDKYKKLLSDSLEMIKEEVKFKQSRAPASARVFLMLK